MKFFQENYVRYGLIMTALVVVCLMLMEITGQNESFYNSPLTGLWTFILPAVVWFLGIWARRKQNGGKISFKQGFIEGFKISLIYGVTSPFVFLVYYLFVNQPIVETVKLSYEMYGMTGIDNMTAIGIDMGVQFISAVIFGSIYSAVIAFIISFFFKSKASK